jgi:dihydroorotate dehydrogenase electron transfer subunit
MIQEMCRVNAVEEVAEGVFVLTFVSRRIAETTLPGQFVNIKTTGDGFEPLLRRPFSVYHTDGEEVQIVFHVIGKGTAALRKKGAGDTIDVLGPLGVPFRLDGMAYDTAVLIGGGLGVAPLPMVTKALRRKGKKIRTFLGSRTAASIVDRYLENVAISTDDGSGGFHGTVVELAMKELSNEQASRTKMFTCGPTPMLRAVQELSRKQNLECEASLEGPMGCGFGICQGCPVELVGEERKYALMCKDGPTFDMRRIKL